MKNGSDAERRRFARLKEKPVPRRQLALRRLQVTEAQLQAVPDISSLLKLGQGGLTQALQALRFSPDPCAVAFLERYDAIPKWDRKSLPWEAIALAAKIDPVTLLGASILAIQARSANAVKIFALSHHLEITRNRLKFARLPGGERDRTAIDTALGFLPTAKGSTFIINPLTGNEADKEDAAETGAGENEIDLDELFPSLSKTQERLIPPRARMLEKGE